MIHSKTNSISRTAIVIGATSGIGKELALLLAQQGYQLGIAGRRVEILNDLKSIQSQLFVSQVLDVTAEDCLEKFRTLTNQFSKVDLIIICSGIDHSNPTLDLGLDLDIINVNVEGFTKVVNEAFQFFRIQKSGHLVVISSLAGIRGNFTSTAYHASKAYQINYIEGLRLISERSELNIRITDIRPGFIDTPMLPVEGAFWISSANEAARQIYKAILQNKRVAYVGRRWSLVAGFMKILPFWAYRYFI